MIYVVKDLLQYETLMNSTNPTPGIVIYRNILSLEEQIKFIDIIKRKGGLTTTDTTGSTKWNFFGKRGRCFNRLSNYPPEDAEFLKTCFVKFKHEIEAIDSTLIFPDVTHILTLWYPDSFGMKWHTDGYGGNNGDIGAPVYSLTLGNSCVFEYKLVGTKEKISVELHSGDIIVFGGPQRLMFHSVKKVRTGSFNKLENFNARINITARTCSDLTNEDDEKYQTDNYVKSLTEK